MRVIHLSLGLVAVIDDQDWELVSKYTWSARPAKTGPTVRHYAQARIDGKIVQLHRFIMGAGPGQIVDHINGFGLDNRRANLRFATACENARNARKQPRKGPGASPYKGVYRVKYVSKTGRPQRFTASIRLNYKSIRLGSFTNEEEAARAYDTAAKQYFGPFARLNFPNDQQSTVPPESKFFQEGTTECGSSRTENGKSGAVL